MKAADLFFSARPMLHLPVWSIYLVSLHYHHELSGKQFSWQNLLMIFCLSLMTAGSYWWNQVFDADSDVANNKLGFIHRGMLTRAELTTAFLVSSFVALGITPFYSAIIVVIFALAFYFSFAYSAPPFRFKDRPIWGLIANAWGIGFLVPFCVMPEMDLHNAGLLGWDNPIYFFLSVASVYLLTTIPDIAGDRLTGKWTVAVKLGTRMTIILAVVFALLSAAAAYHSGFVLLMVISLVASGLTVVALIVKRKAVVLVSAKLPILLLTLLAGYFYPIYLLFIIVLIAVTRLYYRRRFNMSYPRLA